MGVRVEVFINGGFVVYDVSSVGVVLALCVLVLLRKVRVGILGLVGASTLRDVDRGSSTDTAARSAELAIFALQGLLGRPLFVVQ